jgi:hypothetical protein
VADKVERADLNTDLPRRFVEVRSGEFAPEIYGIAAMTGPGDQIGRARFDAEVRRRFVEVREGEYAPEVVVVGMEGVTLTSVNGGTP